jgi:hypothetical protein
VTERRAEKTPDRVATEADRKKKEQELTERLARHGLDRALLVRQLPDVAGADFEHEEPDECRKSSPEPRSGRARAPRTPWNAQSPRRYHERPERVLSRRYAP